jgi:hypothetical protein
MLGLWNRLAVNSGHVAMGFNRKCRSILSVALAAYFAHGSVVNAQEPVGSQAPRASAMPAAAPSRQAPTYQWILSGPIYRLETMTGCRRSCLGIGACHKTVSVPFYVYVLTQVEPARSAAVPVADETVPVPGHEAPFVGNPGAGSVR